MYQLIKGDINYKCDWPARCIPFSVQQPLLKPLQNTQSSLSEGDEKLPVPNSARAARFQWGEQILLHGQRVFLSFGFAGGLLDPSHIPISQLGGVRELRATGTGNLCAAGDGATHTLCQNHTPHSARQGMAKLCSIFLLPETIAWPSWWLVQSSQGLKPYFNICLPFAGLFFFFLNYY